MGKKSNKKKKARLKKSSNYSDISEHIFENKTLIPPFARIPKLKLTSWMNDRMPEFLWASLLLTKLGRVKGLNILREIMDYFGTVNHEKEIKIFPDVTLSGLKTMSPEHRDKFIQIVTKTDESRSALTPLLLYDNLPLKDIWKKFIKQEFTSDKLDLLYTAVANVLDHQSPISTDCRWLKVILQCVSGFMYLPEGDLGKELLYYPNYGDQKSVRPSIRSIEGTLDGLDEGKKDNEWVNNFWKENFEKTPCFAFLPEYKKLSTSINDSTLDDLYKRLVEHYFQTLTTTEIDVKHDTVFGVAFFNISILKEILNYSTSIGARNILRTMMESYVTLAYLLKKDDDNLWKSFRVFGAGQAKLSFIKLDTLENKPKYVDVETLRELANEDVWQEFLSINVGHWENSNLRKISQDADLKEIYDNYYSWTSSFTHANWGALRSSVYTICGNPLHRLHRVPKNIDIDMPSIIDDAVSFINNIIDLVSQKYPGLDVKL